MVSDREGVPGTDRRLHAAFELHEERGNDDICLRIRAVSGSDAGCDSPIPDEWLGIQRVETAGKRVNAGGKTEIRLPSECDGSLVIRVSQPVHPDRHLELDLVRRKPETKEAG